MGPIDCPERSIRNYLSVLRNSPEERRSHTFNLPIAAIWIYWYWYILWPAIGLTPAGSSTAHIYTETAHRTTQLTTLVCWCRYQRFELCPYFRRIYQLSSGSEFVLHYDDDTGNMPNLNIRFGWFVEWGDSGAELLAVYVGHEVI